MFVNHFELNQEKMLLFFVLIIIMQYVSVCTFWCLEIICCDPQNLASCCAGSTFWKLGKALLQFVSVDSLLWIFPHLVVLCGMFVYYHPLCHLSISHIVSSEAKRQSENQKRLLHYITYITEFKYIIILY